MLKLIWTSLQCFFCKCPKKERKRPSLNSNNVMTKTYKLGVKEALCKYDRETLVILTCLWETVVNH
jgi:hypothetical protein